MKNRGLFFILLFNIFSLNLIAEQITVKFYMSNDEVYAHDFDSDITLLNLSDSLFGFDEVLKDYYIEKIEGFNQLEKLKILEIRNFMNILDYSFLQDLLMLNELYIQSSIIQNLEFLETLENLEIIDFNLYITEDNFDNFTAQQIDLSRLLFLHSINFKVTVLSHNDDYIPFDNIPNFINVQNQPAINLSYNEITRLNEGQIKLLSQYSQIKLYPNPILYDEIELLKLKNLNIITR